ncbi:MAG TPA: carboxymuconolactone decarboxylase family protein [Gammaproteobacteria bacterium]|nr:carboxymuconolactone decarboxylase family protein [Gammaproteobacteria bacterium]
MPPRKSTKSAGARKRAAADRMPPLPSGRLTAAQRRAARELAAGPRGAVIGPFIPALRSPEFMRRLQRLGEYLRYGNALGRRLTELAVLLTARAWTQQFEWAMHVDIAAQEGVPRAVVDAIAAGRRPPRLQGAEAAVYDFFVELQATQAVGDATYARAVAELGEAGVVDLVGVIGYYSTLAMLMNVARTPLPHGRRAQLAPLRKA